MSCQFNPLAFVIPACVIFLGLEYWVALRQKKAHLFNYESSMANISVGIAERLLNLLVTGSFYGLYTISMRPMHYLIFPMRGGYGLSFYWRLTLFGIGIIGSVMK
jgi:hypothetical protein